MASAPQPRLVRWGVSEKPGEHGERDDGPVCPGDPRPCIPEGEYDAFCDRAQKYPHPRFKREVIELHFTICEGPHAGTKLVRYFNVATSGGLGAHYRREWVIANCGEAPRRGDRMALRKFRGKLFRVRVATVTTDAYQEKLPSSLCYSKVAAILELLQTNERAN